MQCDQGQDPSSGSGQCLADGSVGSARPWAPSSLCLGFRRAPFPAFGFAKNDVFGGVSEAFSVPWSIIVPETVLG